MLLVCVVLCTSADHARGLLGRFLESLPRLERLNVNNNLITSLDESVEQLQCLEVSSFLVKQ